jgi:hypothetical protein
MKGFFLIQSRSYWLLYNLAKPSLIIKPAKAADILSIACANRGGKEDFRCG